ncbi:hypothetical protein Pmar_PMAR025377, partial [Perkinsus marinus ATCC 50983]
MSSSRDQQPPHGAQTHRGPQVSPRNALDTAANINARLTARFVHGDETQSPPPQLIPNSPSKTTTVRHPTTSEQQVQHSGPLTRSSNRHPQGASSSRPEPRVSTDTDEPVVPQQPQTDRGVPPCFKAPKLALFSGEKAPDSMSLDEWQARWCSIARSKNWTPQERRSNLINSLTGKAYRLLSKQSFAPSLTDEAVEREIWLRLHRSFGQGEKQSFKKLIAMHWPRYQPSAVVAAPGKGNFKGWRSSKGWNQRWSFGKGNQPQKGKGQSKGHGRGKGSPVVVMAIEPMCVLRGNHRRATQEIG